MQALILSILMLCNDDFILTGQNCYAYCDVLKNDEAQGNVTGIYVNGQSYNVRKQIKVILFDTGRLTMDKSGLLTFAPDNCFKGDLTVRYFVGKSWAYVKIKTVQMTRITEQYNYCYVETKGNIKIYWPLARQTYKGENFYYYDTGALMFPLSYTDWKVWFEQKITMP